MWLQREIVFEPGSRGIHLVGREIVAALPELGGLRVGLLHLHVMHTSAGLALNENASPEVLGDLERWLDRAVPEGADYWRHTLEGADDMPAHVKAVLTGSSLSLPVAEGALSARHLAGDLPVRVPQPRRDAAGARDAAGRQLTGPRAPTGG